MAIDFPPSPVVGQKHPTPAVEGVPVYTWDGEKWVSTGLTPIPIPVGTVMLFYQASAPVGWTKLVAQNDKALRVVSGTGGVAGGTNAFSTVMAQSAVGGTTLTTAMIPAHSHGLPGAVANFAAGGGWQSALPPQWSSLSSTSTDGGSGGSHAHSITMNIQYIDLILASKD